MKEMIAQINTPKGTLQVVGNTVIEMVLDLAEGKTTKEKEYILKVMKEHLEDMKGFEDQIQFLADPENMQYMSEVQKELFIQGNKFQEAAPRLINILEKQLGYTLTTFES